MRSAVLGLVALVLGGCAAAPSPSPTVGPPSAPVAASVEPATPAPATPAPIATATPAPVAVVHDLAALLAAPPAPATRESFLDVATHPIASREGFADAVRLCEAGTAAKAPASIVAAQREGDCLIVAAVTWDEYLTRAQMPYGSPAFAEAAYADTELVLGYIEANLDGDAVGRVRSALLAGYASAVPADEHPAPANLRPGADLLGKPHRAPAPTDLVDLVRGAVEADPSAMIQHAVVLHLASVTDERGRVGSPGLDVCATGSSGAGTPKALWRQLGCESTAVAMWLGYRRTGLDDYWDAGKAAFEMGYASAGPGCAGTGCRDEYLQMFQQIAGN